ncbi:Sensor histidine kinase ComP [compost metagenome]
MRYLYSILLLLLLCPATLRAQDQDPEITKAYFRNINLQYSHQTISAVQYLDSIDTWLQQQQAAGNSLPQQTIIALLKTFKQLSWSKTQYQKKKVRYFDLLATNALLRKRSGEALYYYGLMEQEIETQTGNKALFTLSEQCILYNSQENYPMVLQMYTKAKGYEILKSYPDKLKNRMIDTSIADRYICLVGPVITAYAKTGDSVNVNKVLAIAHDIGDQMLQQLNPAGPMAYRIRKANILWDFYRQLYLYKDTRKALSLLRQQQAMIEIHTAPNARINQEQWEKLYSNYMQAYLVAGKYDSVAYYIDLLQQQPAVSAEIKKEIDKVKSIVAYRQGAYKTAYDYLKLASDKEQQLIYKLLEETQETLYASAEAEYNRTELAEADKVKQRRLNWIIAVSGIALCSMLIAYILFRNQRNRYDRRLRTLDNMTEMQIIEAEKLAAKAEQKKLGQDLHDDLSASLAVLIQQLNALSMQTRDAETGQLVAGIKKQADIIYDAVRSKSHLLYHSSSDHESDTLGQHIQKIVDIALPALTFHKEIDIDPGTAYHLTLEQRIAFLRIIQEAVTNIVKHAQSATEVFIFLYHNQEKIILEIGDNGIGMKNKPGKGIGLDSIRNRVEEMQGTLELNGEKGTLLKICIPFEPKESNN